jgi:hypothetical protein
MAQQDDVIIIRTVENITTSILDYFLNIALVTEISDDELVTGQTFSTSGKEEYASLSAVAEKFTTDSDVYKIARDVFAQKTNNGINQSNLRRLVVIRKEELDVTFEACLNRVGYKNSYFIILNQKIDTDIASATRWVSNYRKMLFAQVNSDEVASDAKDDIASILKLQNAGRCAMYYHGVDGEHLAGAVASILASYPVGGKTASYKKPSGITVDLLSDGTEAHLKSKNVNYYVPYIGGAGDYSTRYLTSDNGVVLSGDEIQKVIDIDRTILTLQAGLMDALEQDIPYDDNGGTIIYDKINSVYAQLKRERIFAEDSVDEETGEMDKSYTIKVLPRATVKKYYPDYFAQKMFIAETTVNFAGSGKKVMLTLAY